MALFGSILLSHLAKNLDVSHHKKPVVPISHGKEGFKALVDVHQFKEGEVRARLEREKELIVEACHDEKSDSHGLVSRRFSRRYVLPTDCDPAQLACQVSSDGVLIITAPPKNTGAETKTLENTVDSTINNKTEAVDDSCKTEEVVSSTDNSKTEEVISSSDNVKTSSTDDAKTSSTDDAKTEESIVSAEDAKTEKTNGSCDENKTDKINGSADQDKTEGMNGTSDEKTAEVDGAEDPCKSPVIKQADKKLKLEDGTVVNGSSEVSAE